MVGWKCSLCLYNNKLGQFICGWKIIRKEKGGCGNSFWSCTCHVRGIIKHQLENILKKRRHVIQFVRKVTFEAECINGWSRTDWMWEKEARRKVTRKVWKRVLSMGAYSRLLIPGCHSVFLFVSYGIHFWKVFIHVILFSGWLTFYPIFSIIILFRAFSLT